MKDPTPPPSAPVKSNQRLELTRQYDSTGQLVHVRKVKTQSYYLSTIQAGRHRRYCGIGLLTPTHTSRLEIRLPEADLLAIKQAAERIDMTTSDLLRELISQYLGQVEEAPYED